MTTYEEFLKAKTVAADEFGFDVEANYRDDRQRELWRGYELAAAGGGR